jgi:CRISPR-associated protein Csh2
MSEKLQTLTSRREFLFLYDIKMGNPNGDPDENRPRVLPDGTFYVTDVRLKRFCRDFMKSQGKSILVDNIEGKTTNLTGRVVHYLQTQGLPKVEGQEIVNIILNAFIDARLFGSSLAFKAEKLKDENGKERSWEPKPEPKTLTGPVQINMGEVLHQAESVDIHGTTTFASDDVKTQGTFTAFYGLRYALIGFSGIANEHSAELSRLTDEDYEIFLQSLWHGVRVANTRSKVGQIPHLLLDIQYKCGEEFQLGRLHDYVKLQACNNKEEKAWASPTDYKVNLSKLVLRLDQNSHYIHNVRYAISADLQLVEPLPTKWQKIDAETLLKGDE